MFLLKDTTQWHRWARTRGPLFSSHITCVKRLLSKRPKIGFQDILSLNACQKYCRMLQGEHSAILSTFIKLPIVIKVFVLSFFTVPSSILIRWAKNPSKHWKVTYYKQHPWMDPSKHWKVTYYKQHPWMGLSLPQADNQFLALRPAIFELHCHTQYIRNDSHSE